MEKSRGDEAPDLPAIQLTQIRVKTQRLIEVQADELQAIQADAQRHHHQGDRTGLHQEVGGQAVMTGAVVDAAIGRTALPGGLGVTRMIRVLQEAFDLGLRLTDAALVSQPEGNPDLRLSQLTLQAAVGEIISQTVGEPGITEHHQLLHTPPSATSGPALTTGQASCQAAKPPSRL